MFWNQNTSGLERALEMPWLEHLHLEMGKIGSKLWEGREAVGKETAQRGGSSRMQPATQQPLVARVYEALKMGRAQAEKCCKSNTPGSKDSIWEKRM